MSKVMNIGALDVRDIHEDVAKEISEMANIGVIIENDRSQVLLKNAKKVNVGATIKLSSDQDIALVMQNGDIKIDKEYLEGIINPVAVLVNGKLVFEKDIDINLANDKLYSVLVNGELICPKKILGAIQSKGSINGNLISYTSDYTFFDADTKLTNRFIKTMKNESKLSFNKLLVMEPIDFNLLEEKISNIEVLKKLIIVDEYEDEISQFINDYYSVEKIVLPNIGNEIKYIDEDITINDKSIKKYNKAVLYVDGVVKLEISESIDFNHYIELLVCDKIICNEKTYEMIEDNLDENVEVDIIQGKLLENSGKMILTGIIEEEITIKNMGKLVLDEKLDYDSFIKNVALIKNFGAIEAPEEKISLVRDKVKENFGKIKSANENKELEEEPEDILYANIGELKL